MNDLGAIEPGDWIAIAALFVFLVLTLMQRRLQRDLVAIEKERHDEEIKRRRLAELSVTLERRPGLPNDNYMRLILNNDGPALARDITFDAEALETVRRSTQHPQTFMDDIQRPLWDRREG